MLMALAAAPLLFGIGHLAASVLLALRPDPIVVIASVVALVVNVVLNLWLIPVWGLTAAAMASTLAFLVQSVILMTALTRITGSIMSGRALAAVVVATGAAALVSVLVAGAVLAFLASAVGFLLAWLLAGRVLDPRGLAEARMVLGRPLS
jgi:O-antigen/teichoic acid export membrane protein